MADLAESLKGIYVSFFWPHPFFLFLTLFCMLFIMFMNKALWELFLKIAKRHGTSILLIASAAFILNYILFAGWYVVIKNFSNAYEPNIAALSWVFKTGNGPLYRAGDSAEQYIAVYGPMLYIIYGFFLNILGPSISSSKIIGAGCAFLALFFLFHTIRKLSGNRIAFIHICIVSLSLLMFEFRSFMLRADPIVLLCVSLGLLAATSAPYLIALIITAVTLGVGVNIKIFAAIYFLPVLAILYYRFGARGVIFSIAGSLIVTSAPFLFSPRISLNNYILWLREMSKLGYGFRGFISHVEYGLFFLIPVLIMLFYGGWNDSAIRQNRLFFTSLFLSIIMIVPIAPTGSGAWYIMFFLPLISYAVALFLKEFSYAQSRR